MTTKSMQYNFLNDSYSDKSFKDHTLSQCEHIPSSAYSTIKKSSPLRKSSCHGDDDGIENNQKWLLRRLSSISGSFKSRKKSQKTIAARLGIIRRSRRTYPMSNNSAPGKNVTYYRDSSNRVPGSLKTRARKQRNRQSLAEILPSFYEIEHQKSSTNTSRSSSMSKRIGKIIKKRPKKRLNKCDLRINTREIVHTISDPTASGEDTSSSVVYSLFKPPPPHLSSKASSPSTPLQFPFPPQRNLSFMNNSILHKSNPKKKYLLSYVFSCIKSRISLNYKAEKDEESQESGKKTTVWLLTEAGLFLFGFLFFPLWWLGAWLYWKNDIKSLPNQQLTALNEIFSIKAFAYLNIMLSGFSLIMIVSIITILFCPINA